MINLPIQFADSEPAACTPLAAKASTVGGPSLGVGFGGASRTTSRRIFGKPSGVWLLLRSADCSALFCFSCIRPLAGYYRMYSA
jgi:hypothetical protein